MKITVINGTEKQGVTYKLKDIFLSSFNRADITEYYLPKDCPSFCMGCTSCFMKGENTCKDFPYINQIEQSLLEADLIVMTSPAYVMHSTGAMKAMLDHFGYRWMPHRPAPEMFGKRAVIITQCLGSGAKLAAKDIKHSLSWWGISKIGTFSGSLMSNILWDKLPIKKQQKLTKRIKKLGVKFSKINYRKKAHTKLVVKIKFKVCRFIQKKVYKSGEAGLDYSYWQEHGWLDKKTPWKQYKE